MLDGRAKTNSLTALSASWVFCGLYLTAQVRSFSKNPSCHFTKPSFDTSLL